MMTNAKIAGLHWQIIITENTTVVTEYDAAEMASFLRQPPTR